MVFPSVIAIDGPVASGKTTVGRALAARQGFRFVDTGLMYRAVTYMTLARGIPETDTVAVGDLAATVHLEIRQDPNGMDRVEADGINVTGSLRTSEVETAVSVISQIPKVRKALVAQQRRMAEEAGVVMVGRDIGTEVLPGSAKIYLEASAQERARRRFDELGHAGVQVNKSDVEANLALRDKLDSEREIGALRLAPGAVLVNTEGLTVEQVVEKIEGLLGPSKR